MKGGPAQADIRLIRPLASPALLPKVLVLLGAMLVRLTTTGAASYFHFGRGNIKLKGNYR
jgi:hypothetical protein